MTLLSVVSHHGITVVPAFAAWLWDWSADPGTALAAGCTPAIDHQRRYGRDTVGVREYQGRLVTVIAVDGGRGRPACAPSASHAGGAALSVQGGAEGLRQFDIHLDGIDIVSVTGAQRGQCRGEVEAGRLGARRVGSRGE